MPTHTIKKVPSKSVSRIKSRISVREIKFSQDVFEERADHDSQQWNRRRTSTWQDQNPYLDKEPLVEINRTLKCVNPQITKSLVEFSHTEGCYVPASVKNHNIKLLKLKSVVDHVDTHDDFSSPQQEELVVANSVEEEVPEYKEIDKESDEDINDIEDEESKETKEEKESQDGKETKKLMNQFNFCERATVTHNYIHRESSSQTEPPMRAEFSDYVNQWIIYDSYIKDYEMQQKEKCKRDKVNNVKKEEDKKKTLTDIIDSSCNISKASLVIERMINQNMYNDILLDFRYYEDPSDEFRTKQGTLLPLWKFEYDDCKKLCVTDIKWNENYFDLFVVSFGSFNMQKQPSNGYFCLWSLKNPSYPEYVNSLETGIMSIDYHKARPYLIAVGTYDGLVAVFDCRLQNKNPIYKSKCNDNKHTGAVWQVVWGNDEPDGGLIFFSVSSDGSVFSWTLMHEDLSYTLVTTLNISHPLILDQPQKMKNNFKGSGTCIAFHPSNPLLFFVGSEEGMIYECSCAYMSTYLNIYKAHHMSVNRIHCNHFIPDVFASCSSDWSVKIWERGTSDALFMFDMGSAVGDVKWSKHSSTVLAAVTNDCKVFVFDLNIDKYNPIADQTVMSKKSGRLTRIDFNYKLPIIIVGNDRGLTFALKLSPNLRIKPKIPKKHQEVNLEELEAAKLEKVLSLVREPTGSVIVPNASSDDSSSL